MMVIDGSLMAKSMTLGHDPDIHVIPEGSQGSTVLHGIEGSKGAVQIRVGIRPILVSR